MDIPEYDIDPVLSGPGTGARGRRSGVFVHTVITGAVYMCTSKESVWGVCVHLMWIIIPINIQTQGRRLEFCTAKILWYAAGPPLCGGRAVALIEKSTGIFFPIRG